MSAGLIATLVVAAIAVAGSIGSVLSLSFRVGKLTGSTEARMDSAAADHVRIWSRIGELSAQLLHHIETHRESK